MAENGIFKLKHGKTDKRVVDAFTKNLPGPACEFHRRRMIGECVEPFHAFLSGAVDRDVSAFSSDWVVASMRA